MNLRHLAPDDLGLMKSMLKMFGEAFGDMDTYTAKAPSDAYLAELLGAKSFIALAALDGGEVVGGLAAYVLRKFEQERSEVYIYDLAVASSHRRRGIATALIEKLRTVAASRGAYVIFVEADTDKDDEPAIALYSKMGKREAVLHFDIDVG